MKFEKPGASDMTAQRITMPICSAGLSRSDVVENDIAILEHRIAEIIAEEIAAAKAAGNPVARYDMSIHKPYFEYPDGTRKYDFAEHL